MYKKRFRKTKATINTVTDTIKKLEEEGLGKLVPKKSNREVRQTLFNNEQWT